MGRLDAFPFSRRVTPRRRRAQQLVDRAVDEPLPMDPKFAARRNPAVHLEQPQHLLPALGFAALRQSLLPEAIQTQLLPQFARQPAVAERSRPSQFQPAQLHLKAIDRTLRDFTIVRKQAQRPISLRLFVEDVQRLQPRRLLGVVNFTQVHHRPLHRLP
jgi:hypothetical protein